MNKRKLLSIKGKGKGVRQIECGKKGKLASVGNLVPQILRSNNLEKKNQNF
jgi:hypothetical protein